MDRVIDAVVDVAFAPPLKVRLSRMGFIMCAPIMVILSLPLPTLYVVLVLGMAFSARREESNWREPEFDKGRARGGKPVLI
jgi:Fe2+ transport system protein FeoA